MRHAVAGTSLQTVDEHLLVQNQRPFRDPLAHTDGFYGQDHRCDVVRRSPRVRPDGDQRTFSANLCRHGALISRLERMLVPLS